MAEKRMFTKKVTDTDAFLEMPLSSQALYFHLNMHADDDGFVNNPKRITRLVGASEDDLKLLIAKRFVIVFDTSGVMVIKHWRMHNTLKSDRYHPTVYIDELQMLGLKSNKSYTDDLSNPDIVAFPARQLQKCLPVSDDDELRNDTVQQETGCDNNLVEPERNHDGTMMEPERNQNGNIAEPNWNQDGTADLDLGLDLGLDKNKGKTKTKDIPSNVVIERDNNTLSNERVCRTKDVRRVMEAWNDTGLKPIRGIQPDTDRGKMTRRRITDYGVEAVLEAIQKVKESKFCAGQNRKGWTATYDWFIKPSNFMKCLEGNYDDRNAQESVGSLGFLDLLKEEGIEFN